MENIHLDLPLDEKTVRSLRAGDAVTLSGSILTGRDAAHKRLIDLIDQGKELPVDLDGQVIYYVGPAPASPGHAVGSAGPTTSYRMDAYTPKLLDRGLRAMIGKGLRNDEVVESMKKNGAVYFGAVGGAAALISRSIIKSEVIAYPELGAEAIHRFTIKDFPVIVVIDSLGNNLYESGPKLYKKTAL
ncbi:MAG: Fe-S-containing hydro-lyase [Clostridiales bacterium]|jgi:fumarate hydratase subunit beta|nr:Fe-S-containing hydro-lyase [Clostridiales bacterium]